MAIGHWLRVQIDGRPRTVNAFLLKYRTEARLLRRGRESVSLELELPQPVLKVVREFGLRYLVLQDLTADWMSRESEVGVGNRFANGEPPRGLGVLR